MSLGIGIGVRRHRGNSLGSYWNTRKKAEYFVDGFSGANILDSSGNNLHAISRNTGSFVGNGTAYFLITGLLTTDTITALSSDKPTCGTNGRLDVANTKVVYGITITRGGVLWAYFPVSEKVGACLHDVSGNARHGTMTSGSDALWQVVDLPTIDYLRDNGGSRVPYLDNTKFLVINKSTIGALITDSWEIEFNYKFNNTTGIYLLGGPAYISRVAATTLRLRTASTSIDFTLAVPLIGNMKVSYNGTDTFSCTINGITATASNSKALDGITYIGSRGPGYASINGYIRDFKFTKNGVLLVNIPDVYVGLETVKNWPTITVYGGGALSYYMVPSNQARTVDADGFAITHPQNGHQAIPGTYFSLPSDAELIAACGNITLNDYYGVDDVPNIIDAGSIGHYDPKAQYFDWYDRDNLIIVKDGAVITDANDLLKIKELHYWGTYIADSFAVDNAHIPTTDLDYYKSTIETLLHPDYTDSATTGYYYSTFGPEGLRRTDCAFFMLFFHDSDIAAAALTPFNGPILTTTPRLNVGGDVYDSALFSDHAFTNDYIFMTSVDNWLMAGDTSVSINFVIGCVIKNIQSFRKHYSVTVITLNGNTRLLCDITDYPYKSDLTIQFSDTQVYGTYPSPLICSNSTIAVRNTGVTKFGFTSITNNIGTIDIQHAPILSSEMDRLFAMLNACFTANAPTKTLVITINGFPTGYLTDGVLNADYVNLKAIFAAASKTLTISDEGYILAKPTPFADPIIVMTHDDFTLQVADALKEIYKSRGIKPTAYATVYFLTNGHIYASPNEDFGPIVTWEEAEDLKNNYGWDIQCHGYVHGSINAANMILADAAHVANLGVAPKHIAYPTGSYSDAMIADIYPTHRLSGRRAGTKKHEIDPTYYNTYNHIDTPPMKLSCFALDTNGEYAPLSEFSQWKHSVDVLVEDKTCMFMLVHGMPENGEGRGPTIADVVAFLDYAISKGVVFKSHKEYYDEYLAV